MKSNSQVNRFIKSSILLCRLFFNKNEYAKLDKMSFYVDIIEYKLNTSNLLDGKYVNAKFTLRFEFDKHKKTINWRETAFFSTVIYLSSLTLIDSRRWSYQIYGDGLPFFDLKNLPRVIDEYFKSQKIKITNMSEFMKSYRSIWKQTFKYLRAYHNNDESFSPIANYITNNLRWKNF